MNTKNTILNPKNKTFEDYKINTQNSIQVQAKKAFKDKSFEDEYKPIYLSSKVLRYLCSIVSAITMVTAIYFVLAMFINKILAIFIGIIFCLLFEVIKNYIWNIASKNTLKYKRGSKIIILALFAIHSISLLASTYGAWKIPTIEATPKALTPPNNIDSINKSYLVQIKVIDSQISAIKDNISSSTIRRTIKDLTSQKSKIIEAQNNAIKDAKELKRTLTSKNEKSSLKRAKNRKQLVFELQVSFVLLTFLFEMTFILTSLFVSYYLFRCFIDVDNITKTELIPSDNAENEEKNKVGQRAPLLTNKKIGFLQNANNQSTYGKGNEDNGKSDEEKLLYTKICILDSCKNKFIHNIHNQKFCSKKCKSIYHLDRKKNIKSN